MKGFICFLSYQATAEQIRLAQMIADANDADFENKIKQVNVFLDTFVFKAWPYQEDYWL